jgi:tRNA threonylcarbamoyladenosine biosynthesis protein TsaE
MGPLGAGKTTLVQAACEGAGVAGPVTSPTFTLVHRYGVEHPIYHADLYRIEDPAELPGIGWEDLTAGDAPVFVEWAERAGDRLPLDRWEVRLSIAEAGSVREVRVRVVHRCEDLGRPRQRTLLRE